MGIADKISNTVEETAGKAKEAVGKMAGDKDLQGEGQGDQAKSQVKQAGENIKDAAKNVTGN
jgi:uncharacterized protein YjbJ (UPF0337 family)